MMSKYLFYLLFLGVTSCDPINKLYVKYGEVKPELESKNDSVYRVFFDRDGMIYPDVRIPDEGIEKSGGSIRQLYNNRPGLLQQVLSYHQLPLNTSNEKLQLFLIEQIVNKIRQNAEGKQTVFLIHGFNYHPVLPSGESGFELFGLLRQKISQTYPNKQFQFIEVYWDGCSAENGKPRRSKLNSIKIWDNAQAASNNVGLEFRRVLTGLSLDNIVIITHSLGASVATCSVFNVDKFKSGKFRTGILSKYRDLNYSTPVNKLSIGMIAPAIPGENTFDDLNDRTPLSTQTDNLFFVIGINTNDPVLHKYVGLEKYYGATTLGCRMDELQKVERIVNAGSARRLEHADFSMNNGEKQKAHSLKNYIQNSSAMNDFLRKLIR